MTAAIPPITFDSTLQDQVAAQRVLRRQDTPFRAARIGAPIVSIVLLLVYVLSARLSGTPYGVGLLLALAPFALLLAIPALQTYSAKRALTRFPELHSLTYSFDDLGFTLRTSQTTLHITWDAVRYAAACEGLLILILQSKFAYYIPDRALSPGPVREQLQALIDRQVLGGLHNC